jgi:hypothetical protein
VLSLFLLFVIAAFRPATCCADYFTYVDYYNDLSNIPLTFLEPTFFVVSWLSSTVFHDYLGLFVIYSLLGVTIKGYAIKQLTPYYGISLILYFCSFFLLHEMTQIRVGVAAGILLLSIPYIHQRKPGVFFLLILIGCMFHYSLMIFSFFYFIDSRRINPKVYILCLFLIFFATILGFNLITITQYIKIGFLSSKIEAYQLLLEQGINAQISLLNPLLFARMGILIFFILNYEQLLIKNENSLVITKIYAFSIFTFVALSPLPVLAGRVSQLLGVVEIVLVPYAIYILRPKYLVICIVVVFAMLIMYKQLYYSNLMEGYFN